MVDGGDEATRALAREVGRQSVDRLGDGLTRIIGESSALYRWLLTMLVFLNAAGLWSLVSFPALLIGDGRSVGLTFFLGLLAAIIAAVLSLVFTWPVAHAMRRAITYWTEVAVSGDLTDDAMLSAKRVKIMSSIWLTLTSLAGAASLILFIMGVTSAAGGIAAIGRNLDMIPAEVSEDETAGPVNAAEDVLNQSVPTNAATPVPAPTPTPTPSPTAAAAPRPAAPAARPTPRREQPARAQPQPQPQPQRPASPPPQGPPPSVPAPASAPVIPAPAPAPAPVSPPPAQTP